MAEAQTVVAGDLRKLFHKRSGRSCQFCLWRKTAPIELGWERLWPGDEQSNDMVSAQDALDLRLLPTQQTIGSPWRVGLSQV